MRRGMTFAVALIAVAAWGCGSSSTSPSQMASPSAVSPSGAASTAGDVAQPWPSGFREDFCSTVPLDFSLIRDELQVVSIDSQNGDDQATESAYRKVAALAATARAHVASLPAWREAAATVAALSIGLADLEAGIEAVLTGVDAHDSATAQRGTTAVGNAGTALTSATGLLTDLMSRTGLSCP